MIKRGSIKKKLREEEQQAIGAIYKQYIDTFQENSEIPRKTFVKSDTLYAEQGKQNCEKGQLYNPKPIIKYKKDDSNQATTKSTTSSPIIGLKRIKKKSNLKSLGDELKMLQHERQAKEVKLSPKIEPLSTIISHDNDYSNSTNLFVSNLSPHITENHLIQLFGTYGPLASVKIMWPRNETTCRSANCGFVAFMSRTDAERALNGLKNHEDMRINWGKSVKIPAHPVHIPPELYKLYSPPPPSGLPFNAQVVDLKSLADPNDSILLNAAVKVTIPFDRNLLMLIHRMIEFVIREGPEFEALIMNIESGNPDFNFLIDFQSPAHTYYRWKLYSILNGDPKNSWAMKPFKMYKNGSIWVPPTAPNYKDGMPKELIMPNNREGVNLSKAQNDRLVYLIKNLTMVRDSIAEVMIFCLNHASAIIDILDVLVDSFKNSTTNPVKKVARLYLLSDILYNCKVKQIRIDKFNETNPEYYDIFRQFHDTYKELNYSQDKDCLRTKVLVVLRAWVFHSFFDIKFITKLENIFLCGNEMGEDDDNSLNDEPLDGANLLKRSFQIAATDCFIVKKNQTDHNKHFVDIFNPRGNFCVENELENKEKNTQ